MPVSSDGSAVPAGMTEVERMLAEAACLRLVNALAQYSDHLLYDAYGALFTEDGRFVRPGLDAVGRAQVVESLRQRPGNIVLRHVSMCPVVEILDRTSARGTGGQVVYRHDTQTKTTDGPVLVDYADDYRLEPDGWRVACRSVSMSF